MSTGKKDVYLVIGGSGFLGRHIVEALLARGDSVSVFDIVQRHHDVPFYSGDISEEEQVSDALRKSGATCIIHTASPLHGLDDPALYWKVNVDGTQAVINAAVANGVPKLVYTSSAGVVFNGNDLIDVDERLPGLEKAMDPYNESKAKAEEIVLAANGKGGLYTVALRPAGIFGPGDRQFVAGLFQTWQRGQSHIQVGDNTNLFDWTYVGNCAYAHLLAADRLIPHSEKDLERLKDELHVGLPSINATTQRRRVPTSLARPLGPYVTPPPNAEKILANWEDPAYEPPVPRPAVRGKFDQFADAALARTDDAPLQVAGQVFFITNGEPTGFWDMPRVLYGCFDAHFRRPNTKRRWILPQQLGLMLGSAAEWWAWLVGKEPGFTRYRVSYSCAWRCFNIEKARRVLGYEPQVGLEEGLKKTFEWWVAERQKAGKAQ